MSAIRKTTPAPVAPAPAGSSGPGDRRNERFTAASVTEQLAALKTMTTKQLVAKFHELYGFPTRTNHKVYLQKRLAWRVQELAEGGLSPFALERIEQLAKLAPVRWARPREKAGEGAGPAAVPRLATSRAPASVPAPPPLVDPAPRDPRLPPPGGVLTRVHKGVEHRVTVLVNGFEHQGETYRSLSMIARKITGTAWNGFLFFGLTTRGDDAAVPAKGTART